MALGEGMRLSTYESGATPGVFVTLPSNEAQCAIAMVEKLAALELRLLRADYMISTAANDVNFLALVTARIAEEGYAVHGFEVAVVRGVRP